MSALQKLHRSVGDADKWQVRAGKSKKLKLFEVSSDWPRTETEALVRGARRLMARISAGFNHDHLQPSAPEFVAGERHERRRDPISLLVRIYGNYVYLSHCVLRMALQTDEANQVVICLRGPDRAAFTF